MLTNVILSVSTVAVFSIGRAIVCDVVRPEQIRLRKRIKNDRKFIV